MSFIVRPLPAQRFTQLAELTDAELAERRVEAHVATSKHGFPCRVTLRDAEPGQRLFLLNHTHHEVEGPYRSSHAIFVLEGAENAAPEPDEVPAMIASRLLSIRAFDAAGSMLGAEVVEGGEAAEAFQRLLALGGGAYLHVHTAHRGCYLARVEAAA